MTLFEVLMFHHGGKQIPNIHGVQIFRDVNYFSKPDYIPNLYFKQDATIGTYYSVKYFGVQNMRDYNCNTSSDIVLWDIYRKKNL